MGTPSGSLQSQATSVLSFKNITLLAGVIGLAVAAFFSQGWARGLDIFGGACLLLNHFSK